MISFGSDLFIYKDCNNVGLSFSLLGNTYELPKGIQAQSDEAYRYLGGSKEFLVEEIEVYRILK
jgi:hypothetical protein